MDFKVKITNVVVMTASLGCGERGLITKGYFNKRFFGKKYKQMSIHGQGPLGLRSRIFCKTNTVPNLRLTQCNGIHVVDTICI